MKNYVSLIMDIEKSRAYGVEDRLRLQKYISRLIDGLNDLYRVYIEHDVTFSAGDELQGLFNDVTAAVMYFRLFEIFLNPVKLRAGIGVGEWTVKIDGGLSTQQDGPVYHRARYAIEEVHKKAFHNIRICSEQDDVMANHLLNASKILKNQQIYMQNMVLAILELMCPFVKSDKINDSCQIATALLQEKIQYKISGMSHSNMRERKVYVDNKQYFHFIEEIAINGEIKEAEDCIIVKNVSLVISELLGCSRQNVDSILKRGNANKIRELDYMALQYIERMYR